jgi:hypothetical protein
VKSFRKVVRLRPKMNLPNFKTLDEMRSSLVVVFSILVDAGEPFVNFACRLRKVACNGNLKMIHSIGYIIDYIENNSDFNVNLCSARMSRWIMLMLSFEGLGVPRASVP